jgi:cytochrome c biogenesis protein CcmG, thiol:disulfide interchange protein DsbE
MRLKRMSTTDQVLLGLTAFLVLGLILIAASSLEPSVVKVGARAPSFSLVTDHGRSVSPSQFSGKLLVLNFWATWCEGCVEETASLNRFQNEFADKGVVVVAVSVDRNEKRYRRFINLFTLGFETWHDPEAESGLAARYGTFQFPETYVINPSGHVVIKIIGAQNFLDPVFTSRVQKML